LEDLGQLIEDCKAGKREAQSTLYQLFAPKLFGVCLRYCRDETEAEDTLHEGFMVIFEKIGQFSFKGSFEGWMRKIMLNISLTKFRKRYVVNPVEDLSVYASKSVDYDAYANLDAQQLLDLIKDLSPRYRMVFNLYAIDGYSHKEIAQMLDIDEGTSKSNLSRARKILQEKITEFGYIRKEYAE
jgi:RNA polymerase sigma-70 factor (ECF subfamily)